MGADVRRAVYGITKLHDWQSEMLERHIVNDKCLKNGLVIAPTSGGKTLVSVILLLRCVLVQKKGAVLALPYVALVAEKVRELKKLSTALQSFHVAEYAGSKGLYPLPKSKISLRTLYIATTEKANAIPKFLHKNGDTQKLWSTFTSGRLPTDSWLCLPQLGIQRQFALSLVVEMSPHVMFTT
jgi:ATP-dependent helicase YprA (DUF1998 family)